MAKSSGADSKFEVNEYMMSMHYGVCHGPIDALLTITCDEKLAWVGPVTGETEFPIIQPDLFGGQKKEGGLIGAVRAFFGGPTQIIPDHIAQKMGSVSANCPAYRGIFSLFFYGGSDFTPGVSLGTKMALGIGARVGFTWKSNVPYLPGVWVEVRRRSRGLNDLYALVNGSDANPAHMIYECYTNSDWGMGSSPAGLDLPSLEAAAYTLFHEGFGLSMIWTKQTSIESFINEILDHIQAVFFLNPRTGLMTLKLIRADYVVANLPHLTPDNSKITKFQRKSWAETTNEIVVSWTNPANEESETVTIQDLGNITQQGATVSDPRNYYGVRNIDLATALCLRDLRAASLPLASFEVEVDRSGWDLLPGSVVKISDPEEGLSEVVIRIGPVDYGKAGQPTIKITATEDIFTQQVQSYTTPPPSGWIDPAENPTPMAHVRPFTLPSYLSVAMANRTIGGAVYPEALVGFLASQPGTDTINYELTDHSTGAALGTRNLVGYAQLQAPIAAEASTTVPSFPGLMGIVMPAVGQLVFIGDDQDNAMEIAVIRSVGVSGWVLDRGVVDTSPRAWAAGTAVWFVDIVSNIFDVRTQAALDTVDYKLMPRTSKGILPAADAPVVSYVVGSRPYLPLRPANVKVGVTAFGTQATSGAGPWNVTWSNRNRLTEDAVILPWDSGTVAAEAGQTTTITVLSMAGVVITTINGLTGTSHSLPKSAFGGASSGRVRVTSKRDGFESLQGHEIIMTGIT